MKNQIIIFDDDQEFLNFMDHLEKVINEVESKKKNAICSRWYNDKQ